jgi:hypothetical protein
MEIDLEKTDEVPNIYRPADDRNTREVAAWRTALKADVRGTVTAIKTARSVIAMTDAASTGARSPLFRAAMDLLREEPDQLAVMCKLLDAFPRTPHAQVAQALRECAVLFVHAGIQPAKAAL